MLPITLKKVYEKYGKNKFSEGKPFNQDIKWFPLI